MFKTNDPRYVEQVEIFNHLFRIYCERPRVHGLFWVLGREQVYAVRTMEADSPHVRENSNGGYDLFGLRVYEARESNVSVLAISAVLYPRCP
jgi:hypothetical protein